MKKYPVALIILDGFGYSPDKKYNAIAHASTPYLDYLQKTYPHTLLAASGTAVGLPEGTPGNSEVGHETIGTGRIFLQPLTRINRMIDDESFFNLPALTHALEKIKRNKGRLHIMGLLSDGASHSHENHLYAYIKAALKNEIKEIVIHPFTDGRDTPPKTAGIYLQKLQTFIDAHPSVRIGSLHGRFYAMDRDNHWQRTRKSYQVLVEEQHTPPISWQELLKTSYAQGITDEYILPTQLEPGCTIANNDGIICINFRADRIRQLMHCFIDHQCSPLVPKPLLSALLAPVHYEHNLPIPSLIEHQRITNNTLKEKLLATGYRFLACAETEKYAHVTYFFNGEQEDQLPGETRMLIPSIGAKNYIHDPEMSARGITQYVLDCLQHHSHDFYLINYANADMVGHSGDFEATIKAIECLDAQLQKIHDELVIKQGGTLFITADHGNAECMFDEKSGQPDTMHTANPVPFFWVSAQAKAQKNAALPITQLADIAAFILQTIAIKP